MVGKDVEVLKTVAESVNVEKVEVVEEEIRPENVPLPVTPSRRSKRNVAATPKKTVETPKKEVVKEEVKVVQDVPATPKKENVEKDVEEVGEDIPATPAKSAIETPAKTPAKKAIETPTQTPSKRTPVRRATAANAKTPSKTPSRKRRLTSPAPEEGPMLKHLKARAITAPSKEALFAPKEETPIKTEPVEAPSPVKTAPSTASAPTTLPSHLLILTKTHSALLLILPLLDTFTTPTTTLIPRLALQTGHRITDTILRQCCYISEKTCIPIELVDYGRGRICAQFRKYGNVKKETEEAGASKMEKAKREFATEVEQWAVKEEEVKSEEPESDHPEKDQSEKENLWKEIPLCAIRPDHVQTSKLGEKRRLEILKGSTPKSSPSKPTSTTTTSTSTSSPKTQTTLTSGLKSTKARHSSLLDRIRAKEAIQSTLKLPTKAELQRQMALSRLPEVREILTGLLLSGGGVKSLVLKGGKLGGGSRREKSFSMGEVVERVRGSVKGVIGEEEVRVAVALLDEERRERKTPVGEGRLEVRLVELGTVKGVVLSRE